MDTMTAYRVHEYGPEARFLPEVVNVPSVEPGHALIEVKATSINPIDNKILRQELGLNPSLPAILHGDVAGVVVDAADDAGFAVGDEVYGCAGGFVGTSGALAQFMLADAQLLSRKPTNLSFRESAALPLVSITAWESLISSAKIQTGEHALIHGGVGGVGHIAVQLAKAMGATVSTTVSTSGAADIVRSLGADHVILYREESVEQYVSRLTDGNGFDLIYDTVGGANFQLSLDAAAVYGRVVTVFTGTDDPTLNMMTAYIKALSVHTQNMSIPIVSGHQRFRHGQILREVKKLVESGKVKPLIDDSNFGMADCNAAHARFEARSNLGKIVLTGG